MPIPRPSSDNYEYPSDAGIMGEDYYHDQLRFKEAPPSLGYTEDEWSELMSTDHGYYYRVISKDGEERFEFMTMRDNTVSRYQHWGDKRTLDLLDLNFEDTVIFTPLVLNKQTGQYKDVGNWQEGKKPPRYIAYGKDGVGSYVRDDNP